jgi:3'(2'), 5'-bisphosphate nucleotidase
MANTKNEYYEEERIAWALAQRAGKEIKKIYHQGNVDVEIKSDGTPVTNADKLANEIIVEGLRRNFPKDSIVSEELASIPGIGKEWYVDPIDGTKGFKNRTGQFAIHIGLAENKKPVMGIVYKPLTGEYYSAIVGKGAYRSNSFGTKLLKVRQETFDKDKIDLIVGRSFAAEEPSRSLYDIINPQSLIVSGSAGLRIVKIAEGIANVHITDGGNKYNTWDLCAPHIIAKEAGAYVADLNGNPMEYLGQRNLGKELVVANTRELGEYVAQMAKKIYAVKN